MMDNSSSSDKTLGVSPNTTTIVILAAGIFGGGQMTTPIARDNDSRLVHAHLSHRSRHLIKKDPSKLMQPEN